MIKINLDDIDRYKELAIEARGSLESAKKQLTEAASLMDSKGIGADSLSLFNTNYNYEAMEKKRKAIVSKITSQASNIDSLISSLDEIDTSCDTYSKNVTNDDDEILSLLGYYASDDYGTIEIEDFFRTDDIMTFDIANCDYYVNKDYVKIYVNIPYSKTSEERYKILDVEKGSLVKKLYDYDDKYAVVLIKNNKDGRVRIGYIDQDNMHPTFSSSDGESGESNLEDSFIASSGYGIVKNDKVIVRPFPNSDQGAATSSKYHSRDTYMTELSSGTRVKIVGEWLGEEQDARKSYLVAFYSDSGNFMGFVDGEDLETGKGNHTYTVDDVTPIVTTKETTLYCIDNKKRVVGPGVEFKYEAVNEGGYIVSFNENGEDLLAYIDPEDVEMTVPDSISKIGYDY